MYPTTAAVRQGCTRSVVLSSCGLVPVICGVSKISDPYYFPSVMYVKTLCLFGRKCKDGFVFRLRSEMLLYYRPNWRDPWTCNGDAHEAAAQRKYGVWWGGKWHAPIKESVSTTATTRAWSCRLLMLGGWTAAGRQDRSVVLCTRERNVYPLRAGEPGLHPNLTCVRGDRGCRNPIPGDVAETRGLAVSVPKAKKVSKACHARHTARIAPQPSAT